MNFTSFISYTTIQFGERIDGIEFDGFSDFTHHFQIFSFSIATPPRTYSEKTKIYLLKYNLSYQYLKIKRCLNMIQTVIDKLQ